MIINNTQLNKLTKIKKNEPLDNSVNDVLSNNTID